MGWELVVAGLGLLLGLQEGLALGVAEWLLVLEVVGLRQTLQLASLQHHAKVYWILIEDAPACSQNIRTILEESGLAFAHQAIQYDNKNNKGKNPGHRGLVQRNLGLAIVQQVGVEGVIYFADDDILRLGKRGFLDWDPLGLTFGPNG